jgi:hypothetical protein
MAFIRTQPGSKANLHDQKNLCVGQQISKKQVAFGVFCNCLSIISNTVLLNVTRVYRLQGGEILTCPSEWAVGAFRHARSALTEALRPTLA